MLPGSFDVPCIALVAVALGLAADRAFAGGAGVAVATVVALAAFALVWRRADRGERRDLIACLVIATAGEVFLSLVWGLYEYRRGGLPAFVPPGHALLFLSGCRIARVVPAVVWKPVAVAGGSAAAVLLARGTGSVELVWFALFAACLVIARDRRLYAVMFVLSLALEIAGTAGGSWRWSADVPWTGLTSINPPVCAGAFYCVLDLLVLACRPARERQLARAGHASEPSAQG